MINRTVIFASGLFISGGRWMLRVKGVKCLLLNALPRYAVPQGVFILFFAVLFVSSCGSRKPAVKIVTTAAKAAEVMSALKSRKLYTFITDWTGVKYKLGGIDKSGIDCSGFALRLEKEIFNIDLPRRSRDQAAVVRSKNLNRLEEGDLVFFSFGGTEVDHVGVYLGDNYFVHASTTRGVVVDDLSLSVYQKALVKSGSVKN